MGMVLAVVKYVMRVPEGKVMRIESALLRVSGRVKENVSPPRLLTYMGPAREDPIVKEVSTCGRRPEMEPIWESMEVRALLQVVTVSWSAGSVVGGENSPFIARDTVVPAAITVENALVIVIVWVANNPLQPIVALSTLLLTP